MSTHAPQFEFELTDSHSQYFLYSRAEIAAVLRSIIQKGVLATVHFDEGRAFFLTPIIGLLPDNAEFLFDVSGSESMNTRVLKAGQLVFTAVVDKVKIQFDLEHPRRVEYQGRSAFAGDLPKRLLRLQRREFFRLSTPVLNPIRMCVTLEPDGQVLDVPLLDISGGGVGLMLSLELAKLLSQGQKLENCDITLPGEGLLVANLCVRNLFDVTTRSGMRYVRVGCEFVGMSSAKLTSVQRYIIHVERERKAILNGLA